ncbi:MAG: DUF1501 domain-containing protein [Gemmataceae bacterium]|nr:DUF1501 domain-containing protein [Gemmataceae bacterium]
MLQSLMHIQTGRDGVLNRRSFLRNVTLGAAGLGVLGFKDALTLQADELRKQGMACILLFMRGGPSQMETFDPKPGTTNGGATKAIDTAVEGIKIAEPWTNVAKQMKEIALIRSMTNREGEHQRATYQLHTGYVPAGGLKHPSIGSLVAAEIGPKDFDLPHFVSIGGRQAAVGSGFLGMHVAPFAVPDPTKMPGNVELPQGITDKRLNRRIELLEDLEEDFSEAGGKLRVKEHLAVMMNAQQMVLSPRVKAFDIAQEKDTVRERYGKSAFGQGCLLARRLVEAGVTFIEVESNGWDTHNDNFNRVKTLSEGVDPGFGALVGDLKERGMLDRTLVVWMGEFGRTPRINAQTGRDHFPRAFSAALAGGGVKGGQVIGSTSADGTDVTKRPVTVPDLFCSFCQALKVDARKENVATGGRPLKIVEGGNPVKELFA